MGNRSMIQAKNNKKDEFYTTLEDIDEELVHYRDHFKEGMSFPPKMIRKPLLMVGKHMIEYLSKNAICKRILYWFVIKKG